jgi:hypothetical protein
MPDALIAYLTDVSQRAEIERAAADWRIAGWAEEAPDGPMTLVARPTLLAVTAAVLRGEADGIVVRSLDDVSEHPAHRGVLDWYLRLGARFVALRDGLDTAGADGRRRARELIRAAAEVLRALPEPGWEGRNAVVAEHIPPGSSVLDLGAGTAALRRYVAHGRYVAADRSCWRLYDGDTWYAWWDPEIGMWPHFGERFDVVVLGGVAEYLSDLDGVLARLPALAGRLVLTYLPDRPGLLTTEQLHALLDRRTRSWEHVTTWRAHRIFTAVL